MKFSRLLVFLLPLLLTACGLSDQQKVDYANVQASGVNSAIYDKMVHGDPLSIYDIKALAHARVRDGIVLRYLRDHGTVYFLNSNDVADLQHAGVSQSVIDYMLQTSQGYGPYGPYGPGYYPYPYPYPYPVIGLGFGFGGGYHHWHH